MQNLNLLNYIDIFFFGLYISFSFFRCWRFAWYLLVCIGTNWAELGSWQHWHTFSGDIRVSGVPSTGLQPTHPTPSLTSYREDSLPIKFVEESIERSNKYSIGIIGHHFIKGKNTYMVCLKEPSFKCMNKILLIQFPGYTKWTINLQFLYKYLANI